MVIYFAMGIGNHKGNQATSMWRVSLVEDDGRLEL